MVAAFDQAWRRIRSVMTAARPSLLARYRALLGALFALGFLLTAAVVPGVFTTDEHNYLINVLALRQGHVTVQNTAGLTPSPELLAFDPIPWTRRVPTTPVASTAPPLYAFIALPFSLFEWRGLVALNTLAYLVTAFFVFGYVQRFGGNQLTAWIGAAAFALGGWAMEYSLGLWPHMLSVALCLGAIYAAGLVIDGSSRSLAALSGFLIAVATGVRYQNAIPMAAIGFALLVWSADRRRTVAAFVLATLLPLGASAAINKVRLDSWNPISKGPGYLDPRVANDDAATALTPALLFWGRLVDYRARPPLTGPTFDSWSRSDTATGAHVMAGITVKKAVLQSAPWVILALAWMAIAWFRSAGLAPDRRRQLRYMSIIALAISGVFSFSGIRRDDSLAFNQRYHLELLPIFAIGLAWALDGLAITARQVAVGAAIGVLGTTACLIFSAVPPDSTIDVSPLRVFFLMTLPLGLSVVTLAIWWLARRRGWSPRAVAIVVGIALGWSLTVNFGDDVISMQALRLSALSGTRELDRVLPDGAALVAYWGPKSVAAPLLFRKDLLILDTRADAGRDAPTLIKEILKTRPVFLLETGMPNDVRAVATSGVDTQPVSDGPIRIVRLIPRQ